MQSIKLPVIFASGTFIDAEGRNVLPNDIIAALSVHDDLVRVVELLYNYRSDTCPPLVLQDASQTLAVAKGLQYRGYIN